MNMCIILLLYSITKNNKKAYFYAYFFQAPRWCYTLNTTKNYSSLNNKHNKKL